MAAPPAAGVAGCVARWRASDLALADGAAVASWTDLTVGYVASQATTTAQPLYRATGFNTHPGVEFDGTDDYLQSTSQIGLLASVPGVTIVAAVQLKVTPVTSTRNLIVVTTGAGATSARVKIGPRTTNVVEAGGRKLDADSYKQVNGATALTLNSFYAVAADLDYANNQAHVFVGGALDATAAAAWGAGTVSDVTDPLNVWLGGQSGGAYMGGVIAEVLVYDHVLTDADRALVDSYLADTYGLTVADYNPAWNAGTGSTATTAAVSAVTATPSAAHPASVTTAATSATTATPAATHTASATVAAITASVVAVGAAFAGSATTPAVSSTTVTAAAVHPAQVTTASTSAVSGSPAAVHPAVATSPAVSSVSATPSATHPATATTAAVSTTVLATTGSAQATAVTPVTSTVSASPATTHPATATSVAISTINVSPNTNILATAVTPVASTVAASPTAIHPADATTTAISAVTAVATSANDGQPVPDGIVAVTVPVTGMTVLVADTDTRLLIPTTTMEVVS